MKRTSTLLTISILSMALAPVCIAQERTASSHNAIVHDTVQSADEVEAILRRLPGEDGPLSVAEAMKRFKTPDDLVVEPVLSEPEIGQPLFIDFDERGRMWVLNYKQYPSPAGLTAVSRASRWWLWGVASGRQRSRSP